MFIYIYMGLSENREALSPPVVIVFPRKNRHFGSISFLGKLFVAGIPIWYFINGHATGTDSLEVPIPYIRPINIYIYIYQAEISGNIPTKYIWP